MARELEKSGSKIAQVCNGSKCEELNVSKSSPLYLSVRTSTGQADTSQKGQQPTWSDLSFDHLVGADDQRRRDFTSKSFG